MIVFTCTRLCRKLSHTVNLPRLMSRIVMHPINNKKLLVGFVGLQSIPMVLCQSEQNSNKEVDVSLSHKSCNDNESKKKDAGWERVCEIFKKDEYGSSSKEVIGTIQAVYFAGLVGFIYGGVLKSRDAFVDFMERNQATAFENHLDAKKRLQNHVTIHFAKGGLQWAWRLSLFTGGFMMLLTMFHAYRGDTRLVDYAMSGATVGALVRIKLGLPGIIIGGALGGILGFLCGLSNKTLLNMFGASMDDILSFQYELDNSRSKIMIEASDKEYEKSTLPTEVQDIMKTHDDIPRDAM